MADRRSPRLLLVLVLACLTLTALDARAVDGSPFDPLRTAVHAVLGPPQRVVGSAGNAVAGAAGALGDLGSDEAERLREQNARLRGDLVRAEATDRRLAEWEALLQLADAGTYQVVPARVVSAGAAFGFERTVTLDAGSGDGIAVDQTVVTGAGLVGRTVRVGRWSAVVLLLDDPGFGVGARLAAEGTLGIARGDGPGRLTYVQVQGGRVPEGEGLLTTGSDTFVPGVPVGRVTAVDTAPGGLTSRAAVEPFADVTALDLVGVVVEPPRGTPRVPLPVAP
jgi:rod shape-determining protein MreC